jgi:hypothetical protein
MSEWVKRWGYMLAQTPSRPGIYRLQNGGFLVRGRLTDPRSGKRSTVIKALRGANIQEAQAALDALKNDKRDAMTGNKPQRQLYSDFAISLFQAKVKAGDIKSAKGREKWEGILRVHLLPHFGSFVCDEIRTWHSKMWRNKVAEMIADGYDSSRKTRSGKTLTRRIHLAPGTANTWIGVARTIFSEMTTLLELDRDPGAVLSFFDGSQRPTYTDERPNSLTTDKARAFLEAMHHLFPQHYAMTLLGFATGKRPSTLRPLRARGAEPDVVWDEGLIRFRRSHTRGDEFMGGTKTGTREKVSLPEAVFVALREHLAADGRERAAFPCPGRRSAVALVPRQALRTGFTGDRPTLRSYATGDATDLQRRGEGRQDRRRGHPVDHRAPDREDAAPLLDRTGRRAAPSDRDRHRPHRGQGREEGGCEMTGEGCEKGCEGVRIRKKPAEGDPLTGRFYCLFFEREKGFEPSTSTLARWAIISKVRDSLRRYRWDNCLFLVAYGWPWIPEGCEKGCDLFRIGAGPIGGGASGAS